MSYNVAKAYSIEDLRLFAKRRLPRAIFDFFDGGAEDEVTLRDNEAAYKRMRLVPKVLTDVSTIDTSTLILGRHSVDTVEYRHRIDRTDRKRNTWEALVSLLDGGVRRGSDIFKALAMGAKGIMLGRATLYGAVAAGEAGASRALAILKNELIRTMQLCGVRSTGETDASVIFGGSYFPAYAGQNVGTATPREEESFNEDRRTLRRGSIGNFV